VGVLELAGEAFQLLARGGVVSGRPRVAQARLDAVAVTLGQQIAHIAPCVGIVPGTGLHRGVDAEDVVDGLPQRLAVVEDDKDALLDVKAPVGEIGEQRGRDRGVLVRALPEPERELPAVGGDPSATTFVRPSDRSRRASTPPGARHPGVEALLRARDERPRVRRLRRGALDRGDLLADRLGPSEPPGAHGVD
jgi:hypothetical protein